MQLDLEAKKRLLTLARSSIARELGLSPPSTATDPNRREQDILESPGGAFVTLRIDGDLRGCIGNMRSVDPLGETVAKMAVSSAVRDPRFPPLPPEELPRTTIEISVLSPLRTITDIEELIPGTHGLYLSYRGRSGVLLPQVATEQGWTRDQFVRHTCLKAGCPEDTWRDPEAKLEIFTAEVFSEAEAF